ncbi:class IV adenylate cyclase [Candidatus Binatia bacterium]|jgi:adenylate cyclase class 2|nr:class IV adenylate cyclase [Candidatus Binatia bacterium]
MLEAEIKLALDAADEMRLRERLLALGAAPAATHEQADSYFAHPVRDFHATDEALRLRLDDGALRVTYKGPKLDPPRKTREEIEFSLATDLAVASTLLERLGFRAAAIVRKRRTEWHVPGKLLGTISIDQVEGLGTYCEVEVSAETVEEGRTALAELQQRLGLDHLAPIAESYLELLARRTAAPR